MIVLQNISFSYGGNTFINELSLRFNDGCFTAIIGENGSGKSTLLKLISGIEKNKSGQISIDGDDTAKLKRIEIAKRMSCFPQGRQIPDLSVMETAELGRYPYNRGKFITPKKDSEKAFDALKKVGMDGFAERNMKSLSFGERQKVFLAMNIAQDTQNCLFDEPTNFLDVGGKFMMLNALVEMRNEGRCVVCILHDIPLAMRYADRIVIMKNGGIFADGTPNELFENGSIAEAFGIALEKHSCNEYVMLPR